MVYPFGALSQTVDLENFAMVDVLSAYFLSTTLAVPVYHTERPRKCAARCV